MPVRPLRMGVIGAGANTRLRHIPGFQRLPGVEVAVVANRSRASSERAAHEWGIPRVADDWRAVVEDPGVDAVCIGTWPYLHAEITCMALEAGKHVLTEARMACNFPEARRMLEASRAHPDLVAQVVPSPMTLPLDTTICRMIEAGDLGELRAVTATSTHALAADSEAGATWRQDLTLSGHNTLSLGIVYEAILRWMRDDVEIEAARAAIHTPRRKNAEGKWISIQIPETLDVLGRWPCGARLVMHFSSVHLWPARNEIRIDGSRAGLRVDLDKRQLWLARAGKSERPVGLPADARDWQVEADFVDSIRQGTPVRLTDFATGARTMRFTDDVWRAWSGGK